MSTLRQKIMRGVREYFLMTIGCLLYAVALNYFVLPHGFVGGGVTGIATLVYYVTQVPVSFTYLVINAALVFVGLRVIGRNFGIKTIINIGILTVIFQMLPVPPTPVIDDRLLSAIIAGMLQGGALALVLLQGGTTGGTDIVAMIVVKFFNVTPGRIFLFCDLVIIGASYFLPGKTLEVLAYGYVLLGVGSYVVDMILSGAKQSVQIMVFSQRYEEIADRIIHEARRGVTVIPSIGWYTKNEGKVLVIIARKFETSDIFRIVKEVDPKAFMSVGNVMGVYGQGFEMIKTGIRSLKSNENEKKI